MLTFTDVSLPTSVLDVLMVQHSIFLGTSDYQVLVPTLYLHNMLIIVTSNLLDRYITIAISTLDMSIRVSQFPDENVHDSCLVNSQFVGACNLPFEAGDVPKLFQLGLGAPDLGQLTGRPRAVHFEYPLTGLSQVVKWANCGARPPKFKTERKQMAISGSKQIFHVLSVASMVIFR